MMGHLEVKNKACFYGKIGKYPAEIICYACAVMCYLAGLNADGDKERLLGGVNVTLQISSKLLLAKPMQPKVW
jgi:hypothetical protein